MKLIIAMNSASRATLWRWPDSATARLRQQFPQVEFLTYLRPMDQPPSPAKRSADLGPRGPQVGASTSGTRAAGALGPAPTVDQPPSPAALAEDAPLFADADAVIAWRLDPRLLHAAPRLRWIHCPSAAVHQLLSPELVASSVVVTNGASVHASTVAEHGLALMLALARGLPQAVRDQDAHRWQPAPLAPSLTRLDGATALLLGLGHIGAALAPRLAALGMSVLGVRRHPDRPVPGCAELHPPEALDALLPRADYLVLALPALASTAALIGAPQLARLRPSARVVNLGRGAALDEAALLHALRAGQLAAAALDVFAHEPLAPDSPLWDCPRLLLTPHLAAAAPDSWDRQADLVAHHLRQFLAGLPLHPQVDKHRGY
ncbi:MAG TPA: D-2-hydroxyacid dehydrogenase [Terriglobales bacterium]|nr:D-2-hydroxyacid dehydrogenase [Terriglobales bacterium]